MFGEVFFTVLICVTALNAEDTASHYRGGPLILTSYIDNGQTAHAKVLSAVDPRLFAGVHSHAGYFTVDKIRKWNLFFWYFPAQGVDLSSTPLIVWLNGGPGHTSMFGLFKEIGPIQIVNNKAEKMPITWASNYSLLFIDNPVGTGFSFTEGREYATNDDEVGATLFNLIQQFLQVFPELRKAPLFLAGESYAGKYIPAFGHYIHNYQTKSMPINLKGLAIGNGWIDPPTLLHQSEWGLQMGLLDPEQAQKVHNWEEKAREYWNKGNYSAYNLAASTVSRIFEGFAPVNFYNYLREHSSNNVDLEGSFTIFLNRVDVQRALRVKQMEYKAVNYYVFGQFNYVFRSTAKYWLEELLEHYGVMCYSGQLDVIVAYALSVHTYRSLNWSGAQAYRNAERFPLYDAEDKTLNSFIKASGNFMDVLVRGAGHSVPAYKPRAAKQIIDIFINKFK